jgi:hypothetical protein
VSTTSAAIDAALRQAAAAVGALAIVATVQRGRMSDLERAADKLQEAVDMLRKIVVDNGGKRP